MSNDHRRSEQPARYASEDLHLLRLSIERIPMPQLDGIKFEPKHFRFTVGDILPTETMDVIMKTIELHVSSTK